MQVHWTPADMERGLQTTIEYVQPSADIAVMPALIQLHIHIHLSDASYTPNGSAIAAAVVTSRVVTETSYWAKP